VVYLKYAGDTQSRDITAYAQYFLLGDEILLTLESTLVG